MSATLLAYLGAGPPSKPLRPRIYAEKLSAVLLSHILFKKSTQSSFQPSHSFDTISLVSSQTDSPCGPLSYICSSKGHARRFKSRRHDQRIFRRNNIVVDRLPNKGGRRLFAHHVFAGRSGKLGFFAKILTAEKIDKGALVCKPLFACYNGIAKHLTVGS